MYMYINLWYQAEREALRDKVSRLKKLAVTAGFLEPLSRESVSDAEVNPEAGKVDENLYTIQDGIEELKRSITEVIECWNIQYVGDAYSIFTFHNLHSAAYYCLRFLVWKFLMLKFESTTVALVSSSSEKITCQPLKSHSPNHQGTAPLPGWWLEGKSLLIMTRRTALIEAASSKLWMIYLCESFKNNY